MSEMRTGSTYVSEVLSHTLSSRSYIYMLEEEWMSSDHSVVEKCNQGVVKLHHGSYEMVKGIVEKQVKLIVTVRDPLDAYLSATHHLALREKRSFGNALNLMEMREWVSKMSERMFPFIEAKHDNIEVVIYEQLIEFPFNTLRHALDKLEITYDPIRLKDNCHKFGFRNKTGRNIGDEQIGRHERNGSVGQWKHCGIQEILEKSTLSDQYHRLIANT